MSVYFSDDLVTVHHGPCEQVMADLPDASIDAVVTDPPYGLDFMGKDWDRYTPKAFQEWCQSWAEQCYRLLKPGGHILAFGGSRTWHRLAAGIEDAGFEARDSIAWLYGGGFPKSHDISKAIDDRLGATREVIGYRRMYDPSKVNLGFTGRTYAGEDAGAMHDVPVTVPATDEAEKWEGWGTALRPGFEPIAVGRKPMRQTTAANVLEHGTGALNIGACRIGEEVRPSTRSNGEVISQSGSMAGPNTGRVPGPDVVGKWPTNVALDDATAQELDRQTGRRGAPETFPIFRYTGKAPQRERPSVDGVAHPTVKPLELMRWLVRLVTPPGGTVLDPFGGSGTTAEACAIEGFRCVTIEREADYLPLIRSRLTKPLEAVLDLGGL